jgi:ribosomal protein L11 methyltransferase
LNILKIVFAPVAANDQELLMANLLNEFPFEGFEQNEDNLIAYINEQDCDMDVLRNFSKLPFTTSVLPNQNWNAVWESNFEPVEVPGFCGIRANFHQPITNVKHEIIITPKMSFGTGHHATTYQVIEAMQHIDFTNKKVCDYGTGTGVLAILAHKLGATVIDAIDNDQWSIDNTIENIEVNNASIINVVKANTIVEDKYDIILANINKNILLENMPKIASCLNTTGVVVFSGVLDTDEPEMVVSITNNQLNISAIHSKNNWLCIIANVLS